MGKDWRFYGLLLAASVWSICANAVVNVNFVNPSRFADIGWHTGDSKRYMHELEEHLKKLGDHYLPGDQTLQLDVLDVHLAGHIAYQLPNEPRIIREPGTDWPRMKIKYALKSGNKVLQSGEENISDMQYMDRISSYPRSESLVYEKQMLDDWFRHRFVEHQYAPR